jgi:hypothetical protein
MSLSSATQAKAFIERLRHSWSSNNNPEWDECEMERLIVIQLGTTRGQVLPHCHEKAIPQIIWDKWVICKKSLTRKSMTS